MTPAVVEALAWIQARRERCSETFWIDRLEGALQDLLRDPSRTRAAWQLRRDALGNARKAQLRARRLLAVAPLPEDDLLATGGATGPASDLDLVDFVAGSPRLSVTDRSTLTFLIEGGDAEDLARSAGIAVTVARVRISRARHSLRAALLEVEAAA